MATFKEPPKTGENEVVIWNGSDWIIEPDLEAKHRLILKHEKVQ